MIPINPPFPVFSDVDGQPLEDGYVYVGVANQNPEVNPVQVFWDAAGTIPAVQPIRTSGGYAIRNGTPGTVFAAGDFSITVRNKRGGLVYTAPTSSDILMAAYASTAALARLAQNDGASLIGVQQPGTSSVSTTVDKKVQGWIDVVLDFGAKGDGVTDDTAALQAAVNAAGSTTHKRVRIPYGAAGIYKVTNAVFINSGGITIEWDNNTISVKKFYNGAVFVVLAGLVSFINPGIDGNGAAGYTGSGIYFGDAPTYFTFDCSIINPRIRATKDSCVLFLGPRGGSGIVIDGGSLLTYNASGASSGGYPSIRVTGAQDGDVSPRIINNCSSSSQVLIDVTGMWATRITNCFTGSIFFKGNPDVTGLVGAYSSCAETFIANTYIRDGMTISGSEVLVEGCLTHGVAPIYSTYGGAPTSYATYGWKITSDSIACHFGASNSTSNGILDESPNGLAIDNQSSSFEYGSVMSPAWKGSVTDPVIGNGSILFSYESNYKTIMFNVTLTTGSTTTLGSGDWRFELPYWTNTARKEVGQWAMYRPGLGWLHGAVVCTSVGNPHSIQLLDSASGNYIGSGIPASMPTGTSLQISYNYSRG